MTRPGKIFSTKAGIKPGCTALRTHALPLGQRGCHTPRNLPTSLPLFLSDTTVSNNNNNKRSQVTHSHPMKTEKRCPWLCPCCLQRANLWPATQVHTPTLTHTLLHDSCSQPATEAVRGCEQLYTARPAPGICTLVHWGPLHGAVLNTVLTKEMCLRYLPCIKKFGLSPSGEGNVSEVPSMYLRYLPYI